MCVHCVVIFFFNDTATTEIYTLSLHDALPISERRPGEGRGVRRVHRGRVHPPEHRLHEPALLALRGPHRPREHSTLDRKSTRLNSSHANISYAVFCLKKKKQNNIFSVSSAPRV